MVYITQYALVFFHLYYTEQTSGFPVCKAGMESPPFVDDLRLYVH